MGPTLKFVGTRAGYDTAEPGGKGKCELEFEMLLSASHAVSVLVEPKLATCVFTPSNLLTQVYACII